MKKNIVLLSCLLFQFVAVFGQVNIEINWSEPRKTITDNGEVHVLDFRGASHLKEFDYLPSKDYILPTSEKPDRFSIDSAEYIALNPVEVMLLHTTNIGHMPRIDVTEMMNQGTTLYNITLVPLRVNSETGAVEKLVKGKLRYETTRRTGITPIFDIPNEILTEDLTASVLSSGKWYKLCVDKSGIYRINRSQLNSLGVNVNNVDPRKIQLYGNGGGMLPQAINTFRYEDLTENPIWIAGEQDGSFDNDDYILFYGDSPHKISLNTNNNGYIHNYNIYSEETCYFLTIGEENGKRLENQGSEDITGYEVTAFDDYLFHEKDLENFLKSGRIWFGEDFQSTKSRTIPFALTGLKANSFVSVVSSLMSSSASASMSNPKTNFNLSANGQLVQNIELDHSTTAFYGIKGRLRNTISTFNASSINNSSQLNLNLVYNTTVDPNAKAYINYLGVNYQKRTELSANQTFISSIESRNHTNASFNISSSDLITVWDITNPINCKIQQTSASSPYSFTVPTNGEVKKFIAYNGKSFLTPNFKGEIPNQNLRGITSPPDLLIVVHPDFLSEAQRLASFKRDYEGYNVVVSTTVQIYNEFSSGVQDITAIRDYARMLYKRGNENVSLKYLLLFGDASYDYKDRFGNNTNYVPTYESYESLHNVQTYSSDDYFGFLDDGEGAWEENSNGNHLLDVGVGRFPVTTTLQAEDMVNKIIHYVSSPDAFGAWRNEITFVADDGDGMLHMSDANRLSNYVESNYPDYNVKKIYLDAYTQISTASGVISPATADEITRRVANGTLIVNYTGHGGELGWAQEQILSIDQFMRWRNFDALPLFMTATCEFGRYDDPTRQSAAELLLNSDRGGAINLITTTRPVYASSNFIINDAFYKTVFKLQSDSTMPTIGDVMRITKNASRNGVFNRNFSMLGDPSMRLAYPEKRAVINTVNGTITEADTVNALSLVSFEGTVEYQTGRVIEDFNGELNVIVFDKEKDITTLGNKGASKFSYKALENALYKGRASVTNGRFTISFVIPKDISYQFGKGKVSMYAHSADLHMDAHGSKTDLIIGGSDPNAPIDNTPPEISLYMDDFDFVNGGTTARNTTLIARLSDENGINLSTTGIGREIIAILDDKTDNPFILNEYYVADTDTYKSGTVYFSFLDLAEGKHTLRVKAWDTHNNSSETTIHFVVDNANVLIYNYPNPFVDYTDFCVEHRRDGEDVEIEIEIFDPNGGYVNKLIDNKRNTDVLIKHNWDGRNDSGNKIQPGIYFYRLTLRYPLDETIITKVQRLVFN